VLKRKGRRNDLARRDALCFAEPADYQDLPGTLTLDVFGGGVDACSWCCGLALGTLAFAVFLGFFMHSRVWLISTTNHLSQRSGHLSFLTIG